MVVVQVEGQVPQIWVRQASRDLFGRVAFVDDKVSEEW